MIPTQDFLDQMNAAYACQEQTLAALLRALQPLVPTFGYYNGHYSKDASGAWRRDAFPIPVVSVPGLCDIELWFGKLGVTAKLPRELALRSSFDAFAAYAFEAYGVEDYLSDFYHDGQTLQTLRDNISRSDEQQIAFSFCLPPDTPAEKLLDFVLLLRQEGFYY